MDGVNTRLPPEVAACYEVAGWLGAGAYGEVYRAWSLTQGRRRQKGLVALKRCAGCLDGDDLVTLQRTYREVTVLRQLQHEHIIQLRDLILPTGGTDLYLCFDLMERDLDRAIRGGVLEEAQQARVTCHVLRALKYLHDAQLLHRDVKPSNILVNDDFDAKLCDFGMVRFVGPYPRGLTEYVGMRWYRAPELLLGSHRYGGGVDVWALGCVLGEMTLGRPLLQASSAQEQLELIVGLLLGRPPDEDEVRLSRVASAAALYLVRQCLRLSPDDRPTAHVLLTTSPFLEGHRRSEDDMRWTEQVALPLHDGVVHSAEQYSQGLVDEAARLRAGTCAGCDTDGSNEGGSASSVTLVGA